MSCHPAGPRLLALCAWGGLPAVATMRPPNIIPTEEPPDAPPHFYADPPWRRNPCDRLRSPAPGVRAGPGAARPPGILGFAEGRRVLHRRRPVQARPGILRPGAEIE